jgi:hypothetical protein
MTVAFILKVNLDDLSDLEGVAADIGDTVSEAGFEVQDVQPWARPSITQGVLPTTITPTITTPTINPNE